MEIQATLLEKLGSRIMRSKTGARLFAEERRRQVQAYDVLQNAYRQGPWLFGPDELARQLKEVDPWQMQALLGLEGWESIGGYTADTERERARSVADSIHMYRQLPIAQWAIWLWTSWGLGDKVQVSVSGNDRADEIVKDFFQSDRNAVLFADDKIGEMSRWLLVKGNRFIVYFFATVDGAATARLVDQDEIVGFLTNPDDQTDVWFYKREWRAEESPKVLYYPDYRTYFSGEADARWAKLVELKKVPANGERADTSDIIGETAATEACLFHIAHNIKNEGTLWGWPLATCARAWTGAYQGYMEGRLTLAKAASQFVRRKQVTGGSRALNSIKATITSNLSRNQWTDTNPAAPPGSGVELDNAQVATTDLPLTTGASSTGEDHKSFSYNALLGFGLFQTSAGMDTARWATALEMDKAQSALFEEYRTFWATQFRTMATIAIKGAQLHSQKKPSDDYSIKVTIDTFSLADFPAIAETIGQFVSDTVTPLVEVGALGTQNARRIVAQFWRIAMNALGISDVDELLSDKALALDVEEDPVAVLPKPEGEQTAAQTAQERLELTRLGNLLIEKLLG